MSVTNEIDGHMERQMDRQKDRHCWLAVGYL